MRRKISKAPKNSRKNSAGPLKKTTTRQRRTPPAYVSIERVLRFPPALGMPARTRQVVTSVITPTARCSARRSRCWLLMILSAQRNAVSVT
ncbi:hypothetical protein BaRGS_00002239 [Batillaria attramentaria]|uniref:Histone H3 n=1 Tax=Batillaria attramentaria TaxID=370345 RepID=A0ABD0M4B3_9CAEN